MDGRRVARLVRRLYQAGQGFRVRMQVAGGCRQHYFGVSQPQHSAAGGVVAGQAGGAHFGQLAGAGHHRNPQGEGAGGNGSGPGLPARHAVARPGVGYRGDAAGQQAFPELLQCCRERDAFVIVIIGGGRADLLPQPGGHFQQQAGGLAGGVPDDDAAGGRRGIRADGGGAQAGAVQDAGVAGTMFYPHRTPAGYRIQVIPAQMPAQSDRGIVVAVAAHPAAAGGVVRCRPQGGDYRGGIRRC